jgi:hypothetical protein
VESSTKWHPSKTVHQESSTKWHPSKTVHQESSIKWRPSKVVHQASHESHPLTSATRAASRVAGGAGLTIVDLWSAPHEGKPVRFSLGSICLDRGLTLRLYDICQYDITGDSKGLGVKTWGMLVFGRDHHREWAAPLRHFV